MMFYFCNTIKLIRGLSRVFFFERCWVGDIVRFKFTWLAAFVNGVDVIEASDRGGICCFEGMFSSF